MLIDTHAHVNFRSFKEDAKEVLQRALDNDTWVINIGSQIDTSRQAVELANQFEEGVYAIVGLHPEHTHSQYVDEEETHFLTREEHFDTSMYRSLAQNPKVVGIGECGLDYYRLPQDIDQEAVKQKQKDAFRAQVKLAKELNKVLVIHSRPATRSTNAQGGPERSRGAKGDESLYDDLLAILDEEISPTQPSTLNPQPLHFEVHSYTGSPEYLQKFLDRGAYVSFNGIITFDKTGNMEKLVKMVPLDKMLLETDCPYLAPVPMRGKRNEPLYVKYVAAKVAELKNLELPEVERVTSLNAATLFHIPSP